MNRQLKLFLYMNILLLGCQTNTSQKEKNEDSFDQINFQLLKPYQVVTEKLQHNLHVHLAALFVVLAQNKERHNNENKTPFAQ